jgi:capsular polysaccharide biosynthesis protein
MERDFLDAVLRQRWLVLAVLVMVVGGTAVLSQTLPKVYASSSTLISLASTEQTFESVQAGQALARSYADIIDSPLMASLVAQRLGRPGDATEISEAMRFEPLAETQLLKVTGESTDPDDARLLAATYSNVFIEYARQRLTPSTGAQVALAVPAVRTDNAVRPRPTLYVLLAVILGLPLALGLALLRDRLDGRLRPSKDVEESKGLPSVGDPAQGTR